MAATCMASSTAVPSFSAANATQIRGQAERRLLPDHAARLDQLGHGREIGLDIDAQRSCAARWPPRAARRGRSGSSSASSRSSIARRGPAQSPVGKAASAPFPAMITSGVPKPKPTGLSRSPPGHLDSRSRVDGGQQSRQVDLGPEHGLRQSGRLGQSLAGLEQPDAFPDPANVGEAMPFVIMRAISGIRPSRSATTSVRSAHSIATADSSLNM